MAELGSFCFQRLKLYIFKTSYYLGDEGGALIPAEENQAFHVKLLCIVVTGISGVIIVLNSSNPFQIL